MAQKNNDTTIFVVALFVTAGLIGGGLWAFREPLQNLVSDTNQPSPSPNTSGSTSTPSSGATPSTSTNTSTTASASPSTSPATSGAVTTSAAAPEGLFNYGGSTTWAPLRRDLDPVLQQAQPQFKLRYTDPPAGDPGSASGIKMLLDGQLAFSQSSRPLKDEEYAKAKERGYTLTQIPVAIDGLALAVHPSLTISGLTIAQIKQIYTGQVTNWNQVGGPNLAIKAYSRRPEEGGTVEFFVENILGGETLSPRVTFIGTTTEAVRQVSVDPGGLYYASAPEIVPQCTIKPIAIGRTADQYVPPYQDPLISPQACPAQRNQLNTAVLQSGEYPLTRQLFVIVKQNSQADQQAGEAYANWVLSPEGQELVKKAGFVSIR